MPHSPSSTASAQSSRDITTSRSMLQLSKPVGINVGAEVGARVSIDVGRADGGGGEGAKRQDPFTTTPRNPSNEQARPSFIRDAGTNFALGSGGWERRGHTGWPVAPDHFPTWGRSKGSEIKAKNRSNQRESHRWNGADVADSQEPLATFQVPGLASPTRTTRSG